MSETLDIVISAVKKNKCLDPSKLYSLEYYWACLHRNRLSKPQWLFSKLKLRDIEYQSLEAEYQNLARISTALSFSKLIPQLFNLTALLDDFDLCTYDQEGHFIYPESLAIDRTSITQDDPAALYLLVYRATFFFLIPHKKPDPHLMSVLLGPNYQERLLSGDLDGLHFTRQSKEEFSKSSDSLASRLQQFVAHEEASSLESIRTRLALVNTPHESMFYSIIDDFSDHTIT